MCSLTSPDHFLPLFQPAAIVFYRYVTSDDRDAEQALRWIKDLKHLRSIVRAILERRDVQFQSSNYRKAGIEGVFPGENLEKGIKLRDALKEGGSTVRKLLMDGRFTK